MTENEAKYYLLEHKPIVGFKTHNEALDVAIQALEEIQQYRAIGTVEQLKAIKQWKSDVMEDFCRYDASSFEEIVANARAKAIDEFAERLKEKAEEIMKNPDIMLDCKKCTIWKVRDIDEIAEQLKAGGIIGQNVRNL